MITNIEQELLKNNKAVVRTNGRSMEPLLHENRSSVIVKNIEEPLKKHDVVLFKRNDEIILHRIVKIKNDKFKIRGDNCVVYDTVQKDNIIGVMEGFFPDESETYITCNDLSYKKYIKTLKFRYIANIFKNQFGRALRFILGSNRRV